MQPRPEPTDLPERLDHRGVAPSRRDHSARDLLLPLRRAIDLHLRGDYDLAEKRLRAVLELDPRLPQAHHHLAVVLHAQGRTVEAVRHLREAIEGDPHLPGAADRLETYLREARAGRA
jgi:Tfp pilus assembly protein PilF